MSTSVGSSDSFEAAWVGRPKAVDGCASFELFWDAELGGIHPGTLSSHTRRWARRPWGISLMNSPAGARNEIDQLPTKEEL